MCFERQERDQLSGQLRSDPRHARAGDDGGCEVMAVSALGRDDLVGCVLFARSTPSRPALAAHPGPWSDSMHAEDFEEEEQ